MKPIVQSLTWQSACFEERTGLLTLQKNRLLGNVGELAMHGKPPTFRLSSEPFVLFVSFVVKEFCSSASVYVSNTFS